MTQPSSGPYAWPMTERPGRTEAKYRQIAGHFRAAIERGDLKPEDPLPSQPEIQDKFGASMGTVVNALEMLRREGLVRTEHGRGTFVLKRPEPEPDVTAQLEELRSEVGDLREQVATGGDGQVLERIGTIEANLMDLYGKLGYEYPGKVTARQRRGARG